jgi:Asp-tRNA(Asn)/Glu-tRNA(Gln) amidotransferase A subunit family amidase
MDLSTLPAYEAALCIRREEITSEALVSACLARIAEREPIVQAWAHLDPQLALAQARAADAAQQSRQPLGPLHGVPVGIKDIIDTADWPTENGTPIFAGRRPAEDASVVRQLKAAGAVILGKTVTTELAFFGPGKTRNPRDPERTPGGSSSGSAAAVADFHVPLALGTQTAGSVLRPAAYCGCIGWKPTFGLVSRTGVLGQSPPLDTIGAFARSVEDIALITDCLMAPDANDAGMGPRLEGSLRDALAGKKKEAPRLAFVRTPAWELGDSAMQKALEGFVSVVDPLVEEVGLPETFADILEAQRTVQFHDIAKNYGPLADANPGTISAKLAEVIGLGRRVTAEDYEAALAHREPLYAELSTLLARYDAILTPAAAGVAPKGLASTGIPAFNGQWTYLGVPAISLPLLEADGLPLGVQLVGRRGEDGSLLALGQWMMTRFGPSLAHC